MLRRERRRCTIKHMLVGPRTARVRELYVPFMNMDVPRGSTGTLLQCPRKFTRTAHGRVVASAREHDFGVQSRWPTDKM
jgi:hypothetical protein